MKLIKILSVLISIMGLIHITATFSPLISGKLASLDEATYCAMIYMSLMCGLLLITLGSFITWAICRVYEIPILKRPILIATILLSADGVSAVILMPHNPFAWTIGVLCAAILFTLLYSLCKQSDAH